MEVQVSVPGKLQHGQLTTVRDSEDGLGLKIPESFRRRS